MSVTISTSYHGYSWINGTLTPTHDAYISTEDVTAVSFTPSQPLKSVTIRIRSSTSSGDNRAHYALQQPTKKKDDRGTSITVKSGWNSVTLTGLFLPGHSYSVWFWGLGVYQHSFSMLINGSDGTGEPGGGLAHMDNGTAFREYIAYIDTGSEWKQVLVYADNGTEWEICV